MANKVDGINKLSKEGIKKSRKIVLDSIGENKNSEIKNSATNSEAKFGKKIDGLILKKFKKSINKHKEKEVTMSSRDYTVSDVQKKIVKSEIIDKPENDIAQTDRDLLEEVRQVKRILPGELKQEKNVIPSAKKQEENVNQIKRSENTKNSEKRERKREKEKKEERKKEETIKRKEKGNKEREREKERRKKEKEKKELENKERILKKKEERKKRNKILKFKIINIKKTAIYQLKTGFKRFIILLLMVIIFSMFIYVLFTFSIIKFSFDSNYLRKITKYIPVPALITKTSIVEYYDYKDLRAAIINNSEDETKINDLVNLAVIEKIIINDLIKKYKIQTDNLNKEEIKNVLRELVIYDNNINQVGIKRINKIKQVIEKEGNFIRTSTKYGDELGQISINNENEKEYSFSETVKQLAVEQISDIIAADKGYYIFRCYDKTDDYVGLSYVLVNTKSLDQYIKEESRNYNIWSLVD